AAGIILNNRNFPNTNYAAERLTLPGARVKSSGTCWIEVLQMIATRSRELARWLAVALLLGAVLDTPARADLVGLYRFEDANNPGKDSSPAGNNLSAFGGWAMDPNGRYGQGLAL